MLLSGILVGLVAALLQALSYLVSRHLLVSEKISLIDLMVRSHLFMGAISLIGIPFTWMVPQNSELFLKGLLLGSLAYTMAQLCFFWSIRHAPASRLSPMLGLKLLTSALLMVFIRQENLLPLQIIAVALTILGGVAVQYSGKLIPLKPLLGILAAGVFFGCSDLGISWMCDGLESNPNLRTPWVAIHTVLITYAFIMIPCLGVHLYREKTPKACLANMDKGSLSYAVVWLLAMFCLFYTFSTVGIVFGGIIQATRGPLSIVLAFILVNAGWHHLEKPRSKQDFLKQLISAMMMGGAVAMYCMA